MELKINSAYYCLFPQFVYFFLLITLYFILMIQRSKRNRHFRFEIDSILVSMPIQAEIKCHFNMKRLNNTFLIEVETIQKKDCLIIELIETISNCTRNLKSNQMRKNCDWINFFEKVYKNGATGFPVEKVPTLFDSVKFCFVIHDLFALLIYFFSSVLAIPFVLCFNNYAHNLIWWRKKFEWILSECEHSSSIHHWKKNCTQI